MLLYEVARSVRLFDHSNIFKLLVEGCMVDTDRVRDRVFEPYPQRIFGNCFVLDK